MKLFKFQITWIYKRATIFVALFFSLQCFGVSTETYKDIIEKAYNLSLQKDRTQATAILLAALKRESKKTTAQKEISNALEQIAKIFLSDKAQQLYELGLSLKNTDPQMALGKLQEASRLEPDNLSIEIAMDRISIGSGDCDTAWNRLQKIKEWLS